MAVRLALVLTYLRLPVPQAVVGWRFGLSQGKVSRELRAVLPLLPSALPCPVVWDALPEGQACPVETLLTLAQLADGRVLIDATEQRDYSGKKQQHTRKTQRVTDADHHILAISAAVPGATHDKARCDALHTLDRLPDGVEADADKGDQGLAAQVEAMASCDVAIRAEQQCPQLTAQPPHKKPRGGALTDEQRALSNTASAG